MIRVLCDAIHADLWESLRLLFEVRLGWQLYRPIGWDWRTSGVWRFEEKQPYGEGVAHQFLDVWPSDSRVFFDSNEDGPYLERADTTHPPEVIRLVTMDQARSLGVDLVLCTLAENEQGMWRFAQEVGAHYGIQVGNQGAENLWPIAEFGLLSVTTPGMVPWKPFVTYHQEFDLGLFRADGGGGAEPDLVMNRVQCTSQTPDHERWRRMAALVPEARWRWYGHCEPRDEWFGGNHDTTAEVAASMHQARIAWHPKRWSDGYGHVIHNWFSIGRPVIASAGYYADKLAGPLFVEGETSFDMDRMTDGDLAGVVRMLLRDQERWLRMCDAAADRFAQVVSFDQEAEQIRTMLEGILSDRLVRP